MGKLGPGQLPSLGYTVLSRQMDTEPNRDKWLSTPYSLILDKNRN